MLSYHDKIKQNKLHLNNQNYFANHRNELKKNLCKNHNEQQEIKKKQNA